MYRYNQLTELFTVPLRPSKNYNLRYTEQKREFKQVQKNT